MTATKLPIGAVMHWARGTVGKSQREIARNIGCSFVHLCNVERGNAEPSPDFCSRWSERLRVDPYVLAWCVVQAKEDRTGPLRRAAKQLVSRILAEANLSVAMGGNRDERSFWKRFG